MVDLTPLHHELTRIRDKIGDKIKNIVQKIKDQIGNEPFYARFFLTDGRELIGLISDLHVNEKVVFRLTEQKLNKQNQTISKVSEQKIEFEEIERIEVFWTKSGETHIFIG